MLIIIIFKISNPAFKIFLLVFIVMIEDVNKTTVASQTITSTLNGSFSDKY
jgi:hypothetical protein